MKVFLSSTYKDLMPYRIAVENLLQENDHQAIIIHSKEFKQLSIKERAQQVREADVFVGIYAHLYGYMPKGERISVTEQEYELAKKYGKDVVCAMISADTPWPSHLMEDDFIEQNRREAFLAKLNASENCIHFSNEIQLTTGLLPHLKEFSEKHDRVKKLQAWAKHISPARKVKLIQQLAQQHKSYGFASDNLSDGTYITVTKLIADNFKLDGEAIPPEVLDDTEKLLKGSLQAKEFTTQANRIFWRKPLNFIRNNSRNVMSVLAILAVAFGILLGSMFWASDTAVADVPESKNKQLLLDLTSANNAEAAALYQVLIDSFPRTINVKMLQTRLQILKSNPDENISEQEIAAEKSIEKKGFSDKNAAKIEQAAFVADKKPLPQKKAKKETEKKEPPVVKIPEKESPPTIAPDQSVSKAAIKKETTPAKDEITDENLRHQLAEIEKSGKTLAEKISDWQQFSQTSPGKTASAYAKNEVARLKSLARNTGGLASADAFVLCKNVNRETRMPEAESHIFAPGGKIWMWAKIKTPRDEVITAKWFLNGKPFFSKSASIPAGATGYRIYFSKYFGEALSGNGEVRLYNKDDLLIGQKSYQLQK